MAANSAKVESFLEANNGSSDASGAGHTDAGAPAAAAPGSVGAPGGCAGRLHAAGFGRHLHGVPGGEPRQRLLQRRWLSGGRGAGHGLLRGGAVQGVRAQPGDERGGQAHAMELVPVRTLPAGERSVSRGPELMRGVPRGVVPAGAGADQLRAVPARDVQPVASPVRDVRRVPTGNVLQVIDPRVS